jgi:type IV secretory pathway component VirB8
MPDTLASWMTTELADDSRKAFYEAAVARRAAAEEASAAVRNQGLMFGLGGLFVGAVGIAAALVVYVKTPVPPPPGYILMDSSTGWIDQPIPAKDVPPAYPETIRQRAMRDFVVACESYVPQTWDKIDYHACMVQATPTEQKRREADIGPAGPRYPRAVFGANGWAMPTAFLSFTKIGEMGTVTDKTFEYEVRYERTEVVNGRQTHPHYTARMTFQFHPELKISTADRLINPSGLQTITFSTVRD